MVRRASTGEQLEEQPVERKPVESATLIRRKKGSRKSEVLSFMNAANDLLTEAAHSAANGYQYVEIHINGSCFALSR